MGGRLGRPEADPLVGDFLAKWSGSSGPEIEARVPGITQTDVSRWRRDDWEWLSEAKQKALRDDLARTPDMERAEKKVAARWFRVMAERLDAEAISPEVVAGLDRAVGQVVKRGTRDPKAPKASGAGPHQGGGRR